MGEAGARCGGCAYDAAGLPGNTCPVCGKPIIDHEARRLAAALIEALRDGAITSEDWEWRWPRSTDATVLGAFDELHALYGDLGEGRLVGARAPTRDQGAMLSRWALFLRSGLTRDGVRTTVRDRMMVVLWCLMLPLIVVVLSLGPWLSRHAPAVHAVLLAALVVCAAFLMFGRLLEELLRARSMVRGPMFNRLHPFRTREELRRCTGTQGTEAAGGAAAKGAGIRPTGSRA